MTQIKKSDLIATIKEIFEEQNEGAKTTLKETGAYFEATVIAIQEALLEGNDVGLEGLGKLKVVERASRIGRNPSTGESIDIPASKSVKLALGGKFKEEIKGS